jgi:hypothetical protein
LPRNIIPFFYNRDLEYGPMPQLGGLEPIPILLQYLEICKMMSPILVSFKKVGATSDLLVFTQPNSRPDGTAWSATFPGKFIVLFVVVGAKLLDSTVAPNAPSAFSTLALKKNIYPKIVSEALGHSSVTITLDLYPHVLPNMQDELAGLAATLLKR